MLELDEIRFFGIEPATAVPMTRQNVDAQTPYPEWLDGVELVRVFIAVQELTNGRLRFGVDLMGDPDTTYEIRVNGIQATATLNSEGLLPDVSFELDVSAWAESGVGIHDATWTWEYRVEGHTDWKLLETTEMRFYVGLKAPTAPWTQEDPDGTALPWTDALEIACRWAAGATDLSEIAAQTTAALNTCGRFAYDTANGATNYTTANDEFELDEVIDRINGGEGYGEKLNCTDCATIVSTFANLLGCQLVQAQMRYGFAVRPILAIGFSEWKPPFDGFFSYHEVAWEGDVSTNGRIFDACVHLDENQGRAGTSPKAILPTQLRFGDAEKVEYRQLIAEDGPEGFDVCIAKDQTIVIRSLI